MPQGFPDPYSGFASGFNAAFLPTFQAIKNADRQKQLEDLKKQELAMKKQTAYNDAVMTAYKLNASGAGLFAKEVLVNTGVFDEKTADLRLKQMDQLPEDVQKQINLATDNPLVRTAFGMVWRMTPDKRGEFLLKVIEATQNKATQGEIGKIVEESLGIGQPSMTAQPQTEVPSVPIPPSPQAGGMGSTALAQRLLDESPLAVPVAPSLPISSPIGAPQGFAPTGIGQAKIEQLSRTVAALRLKATTAANAKERKAFGDAAENVEKVMDAEIKRFEKTDAEVTRLAKLRAEAGRPSLSRVQEEAEAKRPPLSRVGQEARIRAEAGRESIPEAAKRAEQVGAAGERGRRSITPSTPVTREFKLMDGTIETRQFEPETRSWIPLAKAPRFQEVPRTREVKRGDQVVTQEYDESTKGWKDVAEAPRFREVPLSRIEQEATIKAEAAAKTQLKFARERAFETSMGNIKAREGLPNTELEKRLVALEKARKSGDEKVIALHEKSLEKYVSSDSFRDRLVKAITASRNGRKEEVHPDLRGFSDSELNAMNIDPIRALMGALSVTPQETAKRGPTIQEQIDAEKKVKAPLTPGAKPSATTTVAPKPSQAKGASAAENQANEDSIKRFIGLLPDATDGQLMEALRDDAGIMKKLTKPQRERVIREVQREMSGRKKRNPSPPGPKSSLTPEERARREAFVGIGVR